MSQTRQLAAIMFTDIVGFTSLMGKDSVKALELIRLSKQIQKPLVEKHHGLWLKEMGDGALAKFSTALDAVNCAMEIQELARAKFDGKLRIGIHLGDITIESDDVYGDGVNIAARLESITDPGGIYISESIEKAIRGQTDIQAKYLGEIKLKNVDYGVRTYALQGVGLPIPDLKEDKHLSGRFFAELQRRGVLRAATIYVILALLLILLVPYVKSMFMLPEWIMTPAVVGLLMGFPIAMYMAWTYELSPDGFVRTNSQQSWQNPYKGSQRKPLTNNSIILAMALIIIAMYVYPRYLIKPADISGDNARVTINDKSLAVLPFDNLSNDPGQEYFSDGMMEAILNHLTKIKGLRLTSRTTMMGYKGINKSIGEIAAEVGVRYVLEGSVQKSETLVRITAQLIDAQSDEHLWSESYDRELADILSLQSEVAQQIAGMLEMNIEPEVKDRIEAIPTENAKAYELYLLANALTYSSAERARSLLEEAISLDSGFAPAYAGLGLYWLGRGSFFRDLKADEVLEMAEPLLNKALELDINLAIAHQYLSLIFLWYKWDFNAAMRENMIAQRLEPGNPYMVNTDLLLATGKYEEALEEINEKLRIEPSNLDYLRGKGLTLAFLNRLKGSEPYLEIVFENSPTNFTYGDGGRIYLYLGQYDKVIELLERGLEEGYRFPRLTGTLAIAYYHTGRTDDQGEIVEELIKLSEQAPVGSPSFYLAMIYAQMGEIDTAFEWLEKAYTDHEVEMYWLKVEPPFKPLHSDPRWQVMLDKVGFPN